MSIAMDSRMSFHAFVLNGMEDSSAVKAGNDGHVLTWPFRRLNSSIPICLASPRDGSIKKDGLLQARHFALPVQKKNTACVNLESSAGFARDLSYALSVEPAELSVFFAQLPDAGTSVLFGELTLWFFPA